MPQSCFSFVQLFANLWAVDRLLCHGILQARILEWTDVPFSRVSSQPRDRTRFLTSPALAGRPLTTSLLRSPINSLSLSACFVTALLYDPAIPLLGIYLKKTKTSSRKNICTHMFIAAFFTTGKIGRQPKCPSMNEWIKKM